MNYFVIYCDKCKREAGFVSAAVLLALRADPAGTLQQDHAVKSMVSKKC
jgi:hypothetical protein